MKDRDSLIPIIVTSCIGKTFIDKELNEEIKKCFNSNTIPKSSSEDHNDVALRLQIRTDWMLHKDTNFPCKVIGELSDLISRVIEKIEVYPAIYNHHKLGNRYKINMIDMWYSRCVSEKSVTDPHIHNRGINSYSFVLYNNLPSGHSSIIFSDYLMSWKKAIEVREGDVLVFSSGLVHWAFDTEVDRSMIAGNFVLEPYTEND